MSSLRDIIIGYIDLSPQERLRLEQQIGPDHEFASLLEQMKTIDALVQQARPFSEDPPGDEALAHYVATRHLQSQATPPELEATFRRVEARLETDADYRVRHDLFEQRMQALETQSDPVAQFERLTGYFLETDGTETQNTPSLGVEDRPSTRRSAMRRWAVGLVAPLVLYAVLFVASEATRSDLNRLAEVDATTWSENHLVLRGDAASNDADATYKQALSLFKEAHTTTLGLFPRYDEEQLGMAADLLEQVIAEEAGSTLKALQASFYLGKIRLAQHDVPAARTRLQTVVDERGPQTKEARRILDALPTQP